MMMQDSRQRVLRSQTQTFEMKIENLKKMLTSRDTEMQLKAVQTINSLLNETETQKLQLCVEKLIIQDICVFLCEASATFHEQLLMNIIRCLKKIAQVKIFYQKSYSPFVVSCMVRTIHFMMKENGHEKLIVYILYLLSGIFTQLNHFKMQPVLCASSSYNGFQLLDLLSTMMGKSNTAVNTRLGIGLVLHSLISEKQSKIEMGPTSIAHAMATIKMYLELLKKTMTDSQQRCGNEEELCFLFSMLCHISLSSLSFPSMILPRATSKKEQAMMKQGFSMQPFKLYVAEHVFETTKYLTSQIKNLHKSATTPNLEVLFTLVDAFFSYEVAKDDHQNLAEHLCKENFLTFLVRHKNSNKVEKVKKLCVMNLAEILSKMSTKYLQYSKWSHGDFDLKSHLQEGLTENTEDLSRWAGLLNADYASDAVVNTLLIYFYFYCFTSPRECRQELQGLCSFEFGFYLSINVASPLLPHLVDFVLKFPKSVRPPEPLMKCLWLCFAMADLSSPSYSNVKSGYIKLNKAISRVANLLSISLEKVYTHDPTLVIWVNSSPVIPTNIRLQVIQLWLDREQALPQRLHTLPTVWCSLLDIIQSGPNKIVKSAANQLKECMESSCDKASANDICASLWQALPDALSLFAVGNKKCSEESLFSLLDLCSYRAPASPDLSQVQRSAALAVALVGSGRTTATAALTGPLLTLTFNLLTEALKQNDTLVLSQYINSIVFLKLIFEASESSDDTISIIGLKTLSFSLFYQNKHKVECNNVIELHPEYLINCLRTEKHCEKVYCILQLINITLSAGNPNIPGLLNIACKHQTEKYINVFKAIFFRLQMVCCKETKNEAESGWICLNSMLKFSANDEDLDLLLELSAQPWTHILIKFYLSQNSPTKCSKYFFTFLLNWLKCLKKMKGIGKLVFDVNKNNMNNPVHRNNVILSTFMAFIDAFPESVQNNLHNEKKRSVNFILCEISEFFD